MIKKKILFLTGTRADFGKMKPLMLAVERHKDFDCFVFVTGMHMLAQYGSTVAEVLQAGFRKVHPYMNHTHGEPMDLILANTISGLSRYVQENKPDIIIVHGDRVEALAGAIVGAINNILVGHIEGGEVSGTIDELIRHAVSKMSHVHFVSNKIAAKRLRQLGEQERSIFEIGSPDIDVMLSRRLPTLQKVRGYYEIPFSQYAVAIFHPVTTEVRDLRRYAQEFVSAMIDSGNNFVIIFPNNDHGCDEILRAYERIKGNDCFRLIPSMRFEYFLTLLKNARYLIGNSSSGICEAPVYAVPVINIGNRQLNRFQHASIINVGYDRMQIVAAIAQALTVKGLRSCRHFGAGKSVLGFMRVMRSDDVWLIPKQKQFCDI